MKDESFGRVKFDDIRPFAVNRDHEIPIVRCQIRLMLLLAVDSQKFNLEKRINIYKIEPYLNLLQELR
jgi:hypothetical protein